MKRIIISLLILAAMLVPTMITSSAADKPIAYFIDAAEVKIDGTAVVHDKATGSTDGTVLICNEKADNASGKGFTLTFNVEKDGKYTVWGRVYYPNQLANSIHYSVDGGPSLIWDFPDEDDENCKCYKSWQYFYLTNRVKGTYTDTGIYGKWTIENKDWRHAPNVLDLKAGTHTIKFTGRETGWMIDDFVITELTTEQYNPNACEGNNYILTECKFCGKDWKHYYKDVYAVSKLTAKEYFNEVLYAEKPATSTAGTTVKAPATGDALILIAAASLLGTVVIKKRK